MVLKKKTKKKVKLTHHNTYEINNLIFDVVSESPKYIRVFHHASLAAQLNQKDIKDLIKVLQLAVSKRGKK